MSNKPFFPAMSTWAPVAALLFFLSTVVLSYLCLKKPESSNFAGAKLAPPTELIDTATERRMIAEYDRTDQSGNPAHPIKICLGGQEGIYHDLDVLVPHLEQWRNLGIRFMDLRFSIDQASGKFTILIMPVKKNNMTGKWERYPYDNTDNTKSIDLGDLHP